MCGCGGGGGGPKSSGDKINSLAFARATGSTRGWRNSSQSGPKSQRVQSIKVDAKKREFQDNGAKAWDQSFFGTTNGFRKGKSKQRASRGSDTSRRSVRGSNGSVRSMTGITGMVRTTGNMAGNANCTSSRSAANKAWDSKFQGASNGFRKGKSKQTGKPAQ
ncbi:hypothetical protein FAGAP_4892 [Fusarium agapanthi]|uniref:Uncharacterized protein n=1 Tax=Fusarium agapanthi TaxID=1803897 RepID=A0A9P5BB54_9HYPO|nr:hypothetical protein FAGAP_4892 [Fusarium agapanthi]